jgi:hypothetical protein
MALPLAAFAMLVAGHAAGAGSAHVHNRGTVFRAAVPNGATGRIAEARLANLRVCPEEDFSPAKKRCLTDRRNQNRAWRRFVCSVDAYTVRSILVTATITYGGVTQQAFQARLPRRGRWVWSIDPAAATQFPLPGGTWGCHFRLASQRLSATFSSDGPSGALVNLAVCEAGRPTGGNRRRICDSDHSAQGIPPRHFVACNGAYLGQQRRNERVDLVFPDGEVVRGGSYRIDRPVWLSWQWFGAGGGLRPGAYRCRFVLDGAVVAEHPCSVHESA